MAGPNITVQMPAFTGAVGSTFSLNMPIGRTYHYLMVNATNLALSEITGIRIIANGQVINSYRTGTELNLINVFDRIPTAGTGDFTGVLMIPSASASITSYS